MPRAYPATSPSRRRRRSFRDLRVAAAKERRTPPGAPGAIDRNTTPSVAPRVDRLTRHVRVGSSARAPRQQVDDAAHRAGAVERRRHALDHFDLAEVHRRNLEQAEAADLLAEERKPIAEEARVPALHALHAHARRTDRRRRRLHAQAAHFVEHHHDVAGRHQHLLFDLLAAQHLDARRLVLESPPGPRAGDDDHLFFEAVGWRRASTVTVGVATGHDREVCVTSTKPSFDTVSRNAPSIARTSATPEASVVAVTVPTTTVAPSTGCSSPRTSTRTRARRSCATTVGPMATSTLTSAVTSRRIHLPHARPPQRSLPCVLLWLRGYPCLGGRSIRRR